MRKANNLVWWLLGCKMRSFGVPELDPEDSVLPNRASFKAEEERQDIFKLLL